MKQKDELSTLIAGVVTEVVTGVVTGVTASRRRYYRNLLIVAIVVAVITFAIAVVMLWNYVPNAQDDISAPAPARSQRPERTPRARDGEKLERLARPNEM